MKLSKGLRLILVGAPGVGKGTQSERLLKRYAQLSSVSSGDLLRNNVRKKTVLGLQAERLMKSGALVPDTLVLGLILSELTTKGWLKNMSAKPYSLNFGASTEAYASADFGASTPSDASYELNDTPEASFLLDGFPRTAAQASQLDALVPMNLVVNISTPVDIVIDRIANRWVHAPSGRVYNTTFNPPKVAGKDDVTGEELTRREDDCPDTWRRRLKTFDETVAPLLSHYDKIGVLKKVEGNSSDEITPQILDILKSWEVDNPAMN